MAQAQANYRASIKALIRDARGKALFVKEKGDTWWGLPGGGLDHGESFTACLRRELREELGAEVAGVGDKPAFVCTVTADGDNPENRPDRKYKLWLVYRVELSVAPQMTPGNQFQWLAPEEVTKVGVADYMGPVYDEFIDYLNS